MSSNSMLSLCYYNIFTIVAAAAAAAAEHKHFINILDAFGIVISLPLSHRIYLKPQSSAKQ